MLFPEMRLIIVTVLLLTLVDVSVSLFPYLAKEHQLGVSFPVSISLHAIDKVFFSTSGAHEVAQLRNKLQSIYPVRSPGLLLLRLNTTSLNLVSSPVLISKKFAVQFKAKDDKRSKRYTAGQHDYHPYCNYISSDAKVEGVFNLCSGVNGHLIDEDRYYKIKSNISRGIVSHFSSISPSTHVPSLHNRDKRGDENTLHNTPGIRRYKRYHDDDDPVYHLELYIVADYDFYDLVCDKNETYCIDEIWSYNLAVVPKFEDGFGINIVIVGIEVWTEGNLIDIDTSRRGSYSDTVSEWFDDEINEYAINAVGGAAAYDTFLYYSSTTHLYGSDIAGLARQDRACFNDSYIYVDVHAKDRFEKSVDTTAHEIVHSLGGEHIEDYGTFYKCWCFPQTCVMGTGELT